MKIKLPELTVSLVQQEDLYGLADYARREEQDLTGLHILDAAVSDTDISDCCFNKVIFDNCRIINCDLDKSRFIDVRFQNCDFSNSRMTDCYFNRCVMESCKCLGVNFYGSSWQHMSMMTNNCQYGNFDSNSFSNTAFAENDFSHAAMSSCRLKSIQMDQNKFIQTNFFKTLLCDLDFSQCWLEGLIVSDDAHELRGMTMNAMQAVEVARLFGVNIKLDI